MKASRLVPGELTQRRHASGRLSLHGPRLEALGIAHGFTTRWGGVNVASATDLAASLADAGLAERTVRLGRQVHGTHVRRGGGIDEPADGLWSPPGGDVVAVRTADCLAVLLASPAGVVAVHAGWRGLLAGILPRAVEAIGGGAEVEAGALGPCIGPAAFEIGAEVAQAFAQASLERFVRPSRGDRFLADLSAAAIEQLHTCGVDAERLDACRLCTHADPERFFSFRRDGAGVGHQAAWIQPPQARNGE